MNRGFAISGTVVCGILFVQFLMAPIQAQDSVTIPMSTYQELLDRLAALEQRVSDVEGTAAPTPTTASSASAPVATPLATSVPESIFDEPLLSDDEASGAIESETGGTGFFATYEYQSAKPVFSNNTAFYTHDTEILGARESAVLTEFEESFQDTHRFELGYLNPSTNLGWRARYWRFNSNSTAISESDVDVKIGVADDPDIAIDTISANDNDFLIARSHSNIDVIDFEGFRNFSRRKGLVSISGGARYVEIGHLYDGRDVEVGGDEADFQTRLLHNSYFSGGGPTIGIMGRHPIGNTGLSLDVAGRASVIFGSGKADWQRFDSPTTNFGPGVDPNAPGDAIVHNFNMRVIPAGEMRVGLHYEYNFGPNNTLLEIGGGFEGQYWMNAGSPMNGGQDGATDSDRISSPFDEDLGILGVYLRAGLYF